LLFAVLARAETDCEKINSTGKVNNAAQLAKTMNKWTAIRGINYKTTKRKVTAIIKKYCKSNPYGTDNDITDHLQNIVDAVGALEK
jgi:muramidase (phage lysozyme)